MRDDGADLAATLKGVAGTCRDVRLDVVIADGGSTDPDTLSVLAEARRTGMRVLDMDGWSSPARRLDAAARAARSDDLVFLEAGVVPRGAGWVEELLSRAAAPRCGAVGALIASPNGVVYHAGFAVGPRFSVADRFGGSHASEAGHAGWLDVAQEVSAVSIAGMLTRRQDFEAVGGFDALRFPTSFFDVDYCLRLRAASRRVLFTPDARFELERWDPRNGSALWQPFADRQRAALAERWRLVPGCDPFYSPWMATDGPTHSGLAWPPPPFEARQPHAPTPFPSRVEMSEAR
ncbi:MAG: glycosyltransferase family 2 protein [Jatrophihabitans endophyticus]|nr:glycosyltransferase family 2 protein [Jatrophihabitans endophyticus]